MSVCTLTAVCFNSSLQSAKVMAESIEKRIESKLRAAMEVTHFEIHDTSGNCGGSFAIVLVSPGFQGKMTLARHKLVNSILQDEIASVHAFSQKTYTPAQWEKEKDKPKEHSH